MRNKPLAVKFILLKAMNTVVFSAFYSFALAYLKANRCSNDSEASLLVTFCTVGAFSGQFFFGRMCDYFRTHKKIYFLISALLVPLGFALYHATFMPLIYLLYLLFGFCHMPLSVVVDTWFLDSFVGETGLYGKVQAGGACTYALCSVFYGRLLDSVGYWIMPYCLTGTVLLASLLAASIPDASIAVQSARGEGSNRRGLVNPALTAFFLALTFTGICANTYGLMPILMENVHGSLSLLGLAMSSSGIAQIPAMLVSDRISHIPARLRASVSGAIYVVMILSYAFGTSPWHLIFGACISGAAWGILNPAYRELVSELAAPGFRSTAQGLADAAYHSVGGMASSAFVSATAGFWGIRAPLLLISLLQITAIAILLTTQFRRRPSSCG